MSVSDSREPFPPFSVTHRRHLVFSPPQPPLPPRRRLVSTAAESGTPVRASPGPRAPVRMRSTAGAARETRAAQSASAEMPPTAALPATRTAGGC